MAKKNQKKMYDEVFDSAHKIWLAGLGALAKAEEEGTKVFQNLVEAGEEFESRGKKRFKLVKGKVDEVREAAESQIEKLGDSLDDKVANAVQKLGEQSREEIHRLTKRVEELTAKVDKIKPAPRPRKATPRATKKS